jgi:Domain of unknown function (DUF4383)
MADGYKMGIARTYALIFGIAYVGVALLEVILGSDGLRVGGEPILQFVLVQNLVHWAVGLAVLGSFFAGETAARMVARIIGIVFVLVSLLGIVAREFTGELLGFDGPLPWSYNVVHIITAAVALFAGFGAQRAYGTRTQTA